MKVIALTAENLLRLKAVHIEPGDDPVVTISGANGAGKQQPTSEPVLTPEGWRPIGDIEVGDLVIGGDGTPTEVTGVYPQKCREVYRVTFNDGGSTRCGPDHLWAVNWWGTERTGPRRSDGRRASRAVRRSGVLTLAEMLECGIYINKGASCRYEVPVISAPVEYAKIPEPPIDPYELGVILGDGHVTSTGQTTITSDTAILEGMAYGRKITPHKGGSPYTSSLDSGHWSGRLKALGLAGKNSHEKFVPDGYLGGSIDTRMALLAGLLDTDASAESAGMAEFSTTSKALADAVVALAWSLGGITTMSGPRQTSYTHNGEKRLGRPSWRVHVWTTFNPFRLERKAERWVDRLGSRGWFRRRLIQSVERVDDEASVCIQVAAEDGLYVTNDFAVTHNTSVLQALTLAMGGGPASKDVVRPIRDGEERAEVVVDLGDIIVTRVWTQSGTSLKVTSADGAVYRSPQAMLDDLIGRLSFDPLEFTRQHPKVQVQTLLDLVGLDPTALDAERAEVYEQRTQTNREVQRIKGAMSEIDVPADAPEAEVSVADLLAERDAVDGHNQAVAAADADVLARRQTVQNHMDTIARLKRELDATERSCAVAVDRLADEQAKRDALGEPIDTTPLTARISDAERLNAAFRARREHDKLAEKLALYEETSKGQTEQIAHIDQRKADAIAEADMPVEGLGFDDSGVTFNGVPFTQSSAAEQLRVSVAMAMALNPDIRVIRITDGSLLDSTSMAIIEELAREHDFQAWVEVIAEPGEGVGFEIHDGAVVSTPTTTE